MGELADSLVMSLDFLRQDDVGVRVAEPLFEGGEAGGVDGLNDNTLGILAIAPSAMTMGRARDASFSHTCNRDEGGLPRRQRRGRAPAMGEAPHAGQSATRIW